MTRTIVSLIALLFMLAVPTSFVIGALDGLNAPVAQEPTPRKRCGKTGE